VVFDLPSSWGVDVLAVAALYVVGHDGQMCWVRLVAEKGLEKSADDGLHSRGQDDDRHVVLLSPVVELNEVLVDLDTVLQDLDALGEPGFDTVQHVAKRVPMRRSLVLSKLSSHTPSRTGKT
jgi:hypothetical protein